MSEEGLKEVVDLSEKIAELFDGKSGKICMMAMEQVAAFILCHLIEKEDREEGLSIFIKNVEFWIESNGRIKQGDL